jgi:zinc transport system permease protein
MIMDVLEALFDPGFPFLRYALGVGLLASVAFGIIGTYVVTRRITYIAGAISHCVLGGIGAAVYLRGRGWDWCQPMYGAVASALLAAAIIGLVSLYARQREDTVIGALWAVGMAVGLLFLARTPGYATDVMSYLFGDIMLVSGRELATVIALDAFVVALGLTFYHKFLAVCFDQEFTELRGVRVKLYYMLLLCLTALTVVLLVRVVGIVMVIALLTLPAAVAGHFARQLWHMMALATVCCMLFVTAGLGVSYQYNLPPGPVIIVVAAAVYLAVVLGHGLRGLWGR